MKNRRCRGSCRSSAAGAHADQALHGLMQIRRCRGSCRSSPERVHADQALHEHQHEAYVSDLSLRVCGIGCQAFELRSSPQAKLLTIPQATANQHLTDLSPFRTPTRAQAPARIEAPRQASTRAPTQGPTPSPSQALRCHNVTTWRATLWARYDNVRCPNGNGNVAATDVAAHLRVWSYICT